MTDHLGVPPWGAIALVTYVPDPLRSFLGEMRQLFPGNDDPQPHITFLPPRPLRQPVQAASATIRQTLGQFDSFEVELSNVCHFPKTNFIYLDIRQGNKSIHQVHSALNSGELHDSELFEFRPHLTLGGPYEECELDEVKSKADAAWRARPVEGRVPIDSLVCLWMPPHSRWRDWRRLWSYNLGGPSQPQQHQIAATVLTSQTF
jgi:2'-5' RNA ligase